MKGQAQIVGVAMLIISGIIGFAILDSLATDATNPATVSNETHTISSVPEVITVSNTPVVSGSETIKNEAGTVTLTRNVNYTVVSYSTGQFNITDYNISAHGSTLGVYYSYEDSNYLHSSISRTIMSYVVPIGLLGLLAVAAGISLL